MHSHQNSLIPDHVTRGDRSKQKLNGVTTRSESAATRGAAGVYRLCSGGSRLTVTSFIEFDNKNWRDTSSTQAIRSGRTFTLHYITTLRPDVTLVWQRRVPSPATCHFRGSLRVRIENDGIQQNRRYAKIPFALFLETASNITPCAPCTRRQEKLNDKRNLSTGSATVYVNGRIINIRIYTHHSTNAHWR